MPRFKYATNFVYADSGSLGCCSHGLLIGHRPSRIRTSQIRLSWTAPVQLTCAPSAASLVRPCHTGDALAKSAIGRSPALARRADDPTDRRRLWFGLPFFVAISVVTSYPNCTSAVQFSQQFPVSPCQRRPGPWPRLPFVPRWRRLSDSSRHQRQLRRARAARKVPRRACGPGLVSRNFRVQFAPNRARQGRPRPGDLRAGSEGSQGACSIPHEGSIEQFSSNENGLLVTQHDFARLPIRQSRLPGVIVAGTVSSSSSHNLCGSQIAHLLRKATCARVRVRGDPL